jgi:hypothetical protein
MDDLLEEILKKFSENPNNKIDKKEVIVISSGENNQYGKTIPTPVVTLNLTDKSAQFHDYYTIIAPEIKALKPLMIYLEKNNYDTNLE